MSRLVERDSSSDEEEDDCTNFKRRKTMTNSGQRQISFASSPPPSTKKEALNSTLDSIIQKKTLSKNPEQIVPSNNAGQMVSSNPVREISFMAWARGGSNLDLSTPPIPRPFSSPHLLEARAKRFQFEETLLQPPPPLTQIPLNHNNTNNFSNKTKEQRRAEFAQSLKREELVQSARVLATQICELSNANNILSSLTQSPNPPEQPGVKKKKAKPRCVTPMPSPRRPPPEPEPILSNLNLNLPTLRLSDFMDTFPQDFLKEPENVLAGSTLEQTFKSPYDWRCVIVEGCQKMKNRGFYLGLGDNRVHRFEAAKSGWREIIAKIWLSKDTCVYGELVHECGNSSLTIAFHIIDAFLLDGKDVRKCHYTLRHELIGKYVAAVTEKTSDQTGLIPLRVKNIIRMENLSGIFENCLAFNADTVYGRVLAANGNLQSTLTCPIDLEDEDSDVIHPAGILFLKITKDPWIMALSRSANRKYWYNTQTHASVFDVPETAVGDFMYTHENRFIWWWDKETRVNLTDILSIDPSSLPSNGRVHAGQMLNHIRNLLHPPPQPPRQIPI